MRLAHRSHPSPLAPTTRTSFHLPPIRRDRTSREEVTNLSNQADARRRAERAYNDARSAGANPRDIAKLKSAFDAAKTEEDRAKKSSGGGFSRAIG